MVKDMDNCHLMPCGRKDCTECESCEYDIPLETLLNNEIDKKMPKFGLIPVGENPSTSQIIIPGAAMRHHVAPFDSPTQLAPPLKSSQEQPSNSPYCNGCEFLLKVQKPNKNAFATRCSAETGRPGGVNKVIKLNTYPDEKLKKPFWCPIIKNAITNSVSEGIKIGGTTVFPKQRSSAMSEEQLRSWNASKYERELKEKWLSAPGITSWAEIKIDCLYHLPPTMKKNRMNLKILRKYMGSIQAWDIDREKNVWLYKEDEEYKYLSLIR